MGKHSSLLTSHRNMWQEAFLFPKKEEKTLLRLVWVVRYIGRRGGGGGRCYNSHTHILLTRHSLCKAFFQVVYFFFRFPSPPPSFPPSLHMGANGWALKISFTAVLLLLSLQPGYWNGKCSRFLRNVELPKGFFFYFLRQYNVRKRDMFNFLF